MQPPGGRPSSPRPLTRRTSKRDAPLTKKSSKLTSPFHLPPVSPTTPTSYSSSFAGAHSSISASLAPLSNQSATLSSTSTPPPTPASSPTGSRPVRRLSSRSRQSDLTRRTSELSRRSSDHTRMTSDLARRQSNLTGRKSDHARKQVDLTRKTPELTCKQSDIARKQSSLTRRQIEYENLDISSAPLFPESPRKVRFGGDRVEYIAGDSSDEEADFYPDPVLKSRVSPTSPRQKDQEDPRRHERSRGRTAENDNNALRKGRSSSRGPPAKRSGTPFVRRGSDWEDEEEDKNSDHDAKELRFVRGRSSDEDVLKQRASAHESDETMSLRRGSSSSRNAYAKKSTPFVKRNVNWEDDVEDAAKLDSNIYEKDDVVVQLSIGERSGDDDSLRRRRSSSDTDDESISENRGRSASRGVRSKRSATPFVRRSMNWEDEDQDNGNESEKNENVIIHGNGEQRSHESDVMQRARSSGDKDDEDDLPRRGRSSSRGERPKRSATPFVRRSIDSDDEDDGDVDESAELAIQNRNLNAHFSPREKRSDGDDERNVERASSSIENDDEQPSSGRGRSASRGARTKRSSTPFVRRNIYWADEDEDGDDIGEEQQNNINVESDIVVQIGGRSMHDDRSENTVRGRSSSRGAAEKRSATPFVRRSVNWEGEKTDRIGLAVIQEVEDCVTIVEDDTEKIDSHHHIGVVQKTDTDGSENAVHHALLSDDGDLLVTVPCSCGKSQILTYNTLTGVDIKPC